MNRQQRTPDQKTGNKLLIAGLAINLLYFFLTQVLAIEENSTFDLLLRLFSTSGTILIFYAIGRYVIPNHRFHMNLPEANIPQKYGLGLFYGGLLLGAYVLIAWLAKELTFEGSGGLSIILTLLFALAYMIQGFSEELIVRGLLQEILKGYNVWLAILLPSIFFSLLHLANDHFSWIAMINTFLIGVFFALLTEISGSLWMAAGAHSIWNFLLGPFFGLPVSGMAMEKSVLRFVPVSDNPLMSGGQYGPEASYLVGVLIAVANLICLYIYLRRPAIESNKD